MKDINKDVSWGSVHSYQILWKIIFVKHIIGIGILPEKSKKICYINFLSAVFHHKLKINIIFLNIISFMSIYK